MSNIIDFTDKIRNMASVLISRAKLGDRAGITYEGQRDLYKELGYQRNIHFRDYFSRYQRGDIAAKVVDAFPEATWRNEPIIISEDDKFLEAYEKMKTRTHMYHYLGRADRISGIGRYAVLLIGSAGGAGLDTPMTQVDGQEDILFFSPYHEGNAKVLKLDLETSSPRFGLPLMYSIRFKGDLIVGDTNTVKAVPTKVHWTRVVHLADNLIEDDIFGAPSMERVWNKLDDLDKVIGGSSEAVWQAANRGIQFDLDKDTNLDPDDEADFAAELDEYEHGQRRFVKTQGITAKVLGSDVPDPRGAYQTVVSSISGATGIPQRILLGSETGQKASEQDERNFNSRVKERQELYVTPRVLGPLLVRFQALGALPEADFKIEWPDLNTLTEKEEADVAARMGQAIKNVSSQTKEGTMFVSPREFREKWLGIEGDIPEEDLPEVIPVPEPANDSGRRSAGANAKMYFTVLERDENNDIKRITLE